MLYSRVLKQMQENYVVKAAKYGAFFTQFPRGLLDAKPKDR
ncbi:ppiC-type peptidyl-prolyl cis-trans isomerase domain protein [Brucella pseudogrignonensis]|jgi:hypothetical protein|uniref:PpiC-type peptidyl-prolyl cis-trans isomerase domain protein n=1 Tax=Brucella pseudogrignonensis TaxID=419475 RepID=A0A256GMA1_9HYPH|nr:ppiC-type peptidyl-prolyl cis-trans isomerase domain protein [Brucella pseudogrignonensis]